MLAVHFWNFSKKQNSTARPSGDPVVRNCVLKEDSGISSPVLELVAPGVYGYNYCYIPDFSRYYYVTEWTYEKHAVWTCTLVTDPLATFRDQIGAATLYILRSSAASDGTVIDDLYPTKTTCTTHAEYALSPWVHDTTDLENISLADGVFIVGYVSKDRFNQNFMFGSVSYSAMEQAGMTDMVDTLLDDTLLSNSGFSLNDATLALQKSLIDPLSYIKSVIWLPVLYASIQSTELQHMSIWDWDIPAANKPLDNDPPYIQYVVTIPLTDHPQAASRGAFLKTAPYTRIALNVPPFGEIELDTTLTANATQVQAIILIDLVTGAGICRVLIDGVVTDQISAQIGVPIQLSQVTKDYLGGAVNAVSGVAGVVGSAALGDVGGAIQSGITGIGSTVRAMLPRHSSIGSNGAFINLKNRPALYSQFMTLVDEDNGHLGRPLCQNRQISSIPGYIKVADGDIDIPGYAEEAGYIKQQLEAGFFYE